MSIVRRVGAAALLACPTQPAFGQGAGCIDAWTGRAIVDAPPPLMTRLATRCVAFPSDAPAPAITRERASVSGRCRTIADASRRTVHAWLLRSSEPDIAKLRPLLKAEDRPARSLPAAMLGEATAPLPVAL